VQRVKNITTPEARARCEQDHVIKAKAEISGPVWEGFKRWLQQTAISRDEPPQDAVRERAQAEAERDRLQAELNDQVARALGLRLEEQNEHIQRAVQAHAQRLTAALQEVEARIRELSTQTLLTYRRDATLQHWHDMAKRYLRHAEEPSIAKRRELLREALDRVIVDLETGKWVAYVNTPREARSFEGEVNNRTPSR
jgi:hypothetical protein